MFFMVIFLSKGFHGKPGDHGGKSREFSRQAFSAFHEAMLGGAKFGSLTNQK